ncbi:hypothetical protein HNQ59_001854 [Chitinivorax tropicus]|uniref:Uncharacterized protein n=1 Tax=Chitinivorax tropicus TaxID=714531 RepID=A0A840MM60_9PROT|nr:hypothetical protein [Chitinivorax tropicus]
MAPGQLYILPHPMHAVYFNLKTYKTYKPRKSHIKETLLLY